MVLMCGRTLAPPRLRLKWWTQSNLSASVALVLRTGPRYQAWLNQVCSPAETQKLYFTTMKSYWWYPVGLQSQAFRGKYLVSVSLLLSMPDFVIYTCKWGALRAKDRSWSCQKHRRRWNRAILSHYVRSRSQRMSYRSCWFQRRQMRWLSHSIRNSGEDFRIYSLRLVWPKLELVTC